jgi:hypothetical protein
MEMTVMGIKRLLKHWRFHGVVIEMEWRQSRSECLIDCDRRRLVSVFGIRRFTTEVLNNQIDDELIIAEKSDTRIIHHHVPECFTEAIHISKLIAPIQENRRFMFFDHSHSPDCHSPSCVPSMALTSTWILTITERIATDISENGEIKFALEECGPCKARVGLLVLLTSDFSCSIPDSA